jgi:hypothetical protein
MRRALALASTLALLAAPSALAQGWAGFVDRGVELNMAALDFGAPGGSNENYYDGDFADWDGDFRMDRAAISRFGLVWNVGDGYMYPVSTQRVLASGSATGPMGAPSLTGFQFGDGYAGNDGVQWADLDGDGDPDSIQGGNGEPFVVQSNRAGRFVETGRYSGSALNIANTDVEGDGDVDLAVAHAFCSERNCGGPISFKLWVNDGSGALRDETAARGLGAYNSQCQLVVGVASADVDRDGDFDLLLAVGAYDEQRCPGSPPPRNAIVVALNDGTGRYAERVVPFARPVAELLTIGSGFGQHLTLGDVDDDGDLDVVYAAPAMQDPVTLATYGVSLHPNVAHVVMINDGAGNFTDDSVARWDVGAYTGALSAGNAKLADFDHDGDLDVLAFEKPGPDFFQLFLNDGTGRFVYRPDLDPGGWVNLGRGLGVDLDIADIDGDGALDAWIGIAALKPNPLINAYATPSGIRADLPRNVRVVAADATGVTIAWEHPPQAGANRHYRVLRTPAAGLEPRDRTVVKVVALSPHEDDSFSAPLSRHVTTAELGDPDIALDGATGTVTWMDRSAAPGITYEYSVVHVGSERTPSRPSWEVAAAVPDPDPAGADTTPPELRIVSPTGEEWGRHPRVVLDFADGRSGIDPASLELSFDVDVPGAPAGTNLADRLARVGAHAAIGRLDASAPLPPGLVTLTARVADVAGNVAQRSVTFNVSVSASSYPTASAVASPRPGTQVVDFDASGSADTDGVDPTRGPLGILMRWEWDFGDGTTGEGQRATHRYRNPGAHLVKLVVRDNEGGVGSTSQLLVVGAADPDTDGDGLTDGEELDRRTDPDRRDTDGDGVGDRADCTPLDARAWDAGAEVTDLRLAGAATTTLSWTAAPSGATLEHDVVTGAILDLRLLGLEAAASTCVVRGLRTAVLAGTATPPPGGAFYLVRAATACGSASGWGSDSFGVARVAGSCGPR